MNGELSLVRSGIIVFPVKPQEKSISEVKTVEIEETVVTVVEETKTTKKESRFARLKKSLRKGSKSIL